MRAAEPDAVPLARVAPFDEDGSGCRQEQAVDQLQQRGFPDAAAADDGDDLAGADCEVHPCEDRSLRFRGGTRHRRS